MQVENGKHAEHVELHHAGPGELFMSNHLTNNLDVQLSKSDLPEVLRKYSEAELAVMEKALVRKIDIRLLPILIIMYVMNYLDRNNIAAARLTGKVGLQKQLDMNDTQYNTCVSILFVGYLLMQVPSNLFLNKIGKPALYLPTCMIIWGTISASTAAAHNYSGLVAIRFFLGFIEAAYFPGCLFFLSSWYTRKELSFRTAALYSGSLISGAFSGLIAAAVSAHLDGKRGIAAWRWLFIIEGSITIVIAFAAYFILPNFPRTTGWLSEEEKALGAYRLQRDVGLEDWTSSNDQTFFHGFALAFRDGKTYILMLILIGIVSSGSVTNFFPTVVATLGYNKINTLLLTAPPYVLAVITSLFNAWHADRSHERYFHVITPLILTVVAFIIAASTTNTAARYVAMMLMPSTIYASFVVALSWISSSIPRPPAKRAATLAAINAISNSTSIYASYMYKTSFSPQYTAAFSVDCATAAIAILAATALRFVLARLNAKLDRGEHVEGAVVGEGSQNDLAAEKGFRFLL